MEQKDITQMTKDEVRAHLDQMEKQEKQERAEKKEQYEKERDADIQQFVTAAIMHHNHMKVFKKSVADMMNERKEQLDQYGGIRSNSKGGFSLTHSDGTMRIVRTRSTKPDWDERSNKAIELISSFLSDTVKKKDKNLFEILIGFISHDKEGNLEYAKVMELIQHRDKYDDERWLEGLDLILESYRLDQTGFGYDVMIKNNEGKWERVELSFSAISIELNETPTEDETGKTA